VVAVAVAVPAADEAAGVPCAKFEGGHHRVVGTAARGGDSGDRADGGDRGDGGDIASPSPASDAPIAAPAASAIYAPLPQGLTWPSALRHQLYSGGVEGVYVFHATFVRHILSVLFHSNPAQKQAMPSTNAIVCQHAMPLLSTC
jgi:hypothetical protein